MNYVLAHWDEIAGIAAAFVLFFDRLAKITPSDSDNKLLTALYKIFAVLGLKVPDVK